MISLIKVISIIFLGIIIAATIGFTLLHVNRSQTVDETLVSNLTSQLDTRLIDKVYTSLTR